MMKNKSIQGLRGLFAIGVLLSHCYFLGDYGQSEIIFNSVLQKLANVGFFFIVAGYFLARSSSVNLSLWHFLKKKMTRVYPLHLLVLLALVGLAVLTDAFEFNLTLPLNALLIQTWIPSIESATSYNTVSWFLSSLMFCYIVGYLVVRFCRYSRRYIYIYILTLCLVLYKVVISLVFPTGDTGYYWCYLSPIAGCADFLVGVSVALLLKDKEMPNMLWLQCLSLLLLVASFALKQYLPTNYCRGFFMLPANILTLVSFVTETRFSKCLFGNKFLVFLGDISFEIYLLHPLIIRLVGNRSIAKMLSDVSPFITLLVLVTCCIVAAVIYKKIFILFTKFIKNKKAEV